jgi:hypothetical protein
MTGTKTIHAYIGKLDGKCEISYYHGQDVNWRYDIDIEDAMTAVRQIQEKYSEK